MTGELSRRVRLHRVSWLDNKCLICAIPVLFHYALLCLHAKVRSRQILITFLYVRVFTYFSVHYAFKSYMEIYERWNAKDVEVIYYGLFQGRVLTSYWRDRINTVKTQDKRCFRRDSNPEFPQYKLWLSPELAWSVCILCFNYDQCIKTIIINHWYWNWHPCWGYLILWNLRFSWRCLWKLLSSGMWPW
jgi:hypothetical protein